MKRPLGFVGDVSRDAFSEETRMEIDGNRRVILDGKCRILVYDEDTIRLETAHGALCFRGRELRLAEFERLNTTVVGRLTSIEFE